MAIQRYSDSFGDTMPHSFSTMLDRFFNDSLNARGRMSAFMPQVDAYETERSYEIEAALPGMKREDIKVEFQQGRLTISGERRQQQERNDRRYHLMESQYGSFHRSFQLPDVANGQGIEAHFEDGVLRVSVPKDQQKTMRHQIQVRGGQQQSGTPSGQVTDRMGQQATDVRVEIGANGSAAGNGQAPRDMASGMYQASAASADGGSTIMAGGALDRNGMHESYGDGHPDDGAGSLRGSGVGS